MDSESMSESEAGAMRDAAITDPPTQNTPAKTAEQRRADDGSLRNQTVSFAPWFIQWLWLAAGVAAVGYFNNRNWVMFEAIPFVIAVAFALTAWLQWCIAWAILARRSVAHRLGYVATGILAILVVFDWILDWRHNNTNQLVVAMARLAVGFTVPLVLVYWRGWRIELSSTNTPELSSSCRRQFSIGELLLLTAGIAVLLWLTVAQRDVLSGHVPWGELLTEMVLVACGTMFVVVGLAARRFAIATAI